MRPTDNDPKGNDPVDRDPTNEEIVDYLKRGLVMRMHFCPLIGKKVGKKLTTFQFRTEFQGAEYRFEGMWLDGAGTKVLAGMINKEYARAKALASLLDDKCFPGVEAWVVACRNVLGDNIDTFPLAGVIFVEGQWNSVIGPPKTKRKFSLTSVDELLDALEDERLAKECVEPVYEPVAPPADKADGKQPASPADDKTDDKHLDPTDEQLDNSQVSLQYMQFFCEQHQPKLQTVSS